MTLLKLSGLAALATVAYWLALYFYELWSSPLRSLPGPKSQSWLFGNMGSILKSEDGAQHAAWRNAYGRTYRYKIFFNKDRLFTLDGKALGHVLAHSDIYQKPEAARFGLGRIVGQGVLVQEGERHKQQRRVMNPAFGNAQIRALTQIFVDKSIELRDVWSNKCQNGDKDKFELESGQTRIEVMSWLSRMTLDVIGLAGFNYNFDSLGAQEKPSELNKAFQTIFHSTSQRSLLLFLQSQITFTRRIAPYFEAQRKELKSAHETMNRIGRELFDQSKAAGEKGGVGKDLLSLLIRANTGEDVQGHQRLSDEDVLAQVPTFITAGHETTSTATTWALYAMSKDKEIQTKLREALLAIPTENPTMEDLNSIQYLDWVVRETLRLHSPVQATIRVATQDDVIPLGEPFRDANGHMQDSIKMNKGQSVFLPIVNLNRDPHYFGEDAAVFNPERWSNLPETANEIPGVWGNIMSFLGGTHACIGYKFSLVEMKALLFVLVRAFEFDFAVPVEDIMKQSAVVTRPVLRSDKKAGSQLPLLVRPYVRD